MLKSLRKPKTPVSFFVAGLGNPGPDYATTRHNIGYMVIDELARRHHTTLGLHKKTRTRLATVSVGGKPGVIGTPTSFMNVSGGPVSALLKYQSLTPEQLIVIHDELD